MSPSIALVIAALAVRCGTRPVVSNKIEHDLVMPCRTVPRRGPVIDRSTDAIDGISTPELAVAAVDFDTGEPAIGATVVVRDATGHERVMILGENGAVTFPSLPAGPYTVQLLGGGDPVSIDATLRDASRTILAVRLDTLPACDD